MATEIEAITVANLLAVVYFKYNDMITFNSHVWLFLMPVFKASSNCKKIQYEWITKQLANLSLYQIMTRRLESPFFKAISILSGWWQRNKLGKPRFLWGHIAPFLDHGLLDLPGVGPWPGANLLGDVNALLSGLQLRHQLSDMFASSLGFQCTLLLGGVLDNGLTFSKHSSWPSLKQQPARAQSSLGILYFFTFFLDTLQTSLGHLEQSVVVV